jgi:hypothetical protein
MRRIVVALLAIAVLAALAVWPRHSRRPPDPDRDEASVASSAPSRATVPRPPAAGHGESTRVHQPPLKLAAPLGPPDRPLRARIGWNSPGLCDHGVDMLAQAQRRQALLQTFRREEVKGVAIDHDDAVTGEALEAIRFAIGRTRQYANYLLGWNPKDFVPSIHVYRSVEQLRSVACISRTSIAYYDGALHLTGDPRYTSATLMQETAHEYVHHILVTMGVSRPIWLHEGLAMQIAEERWWKKGQTGLEREHLPFATLVDDFPHTLPDEQRASAAYYQSYMMVAFLRQRRGPAYFRELLDDLAWGRLAPEEAFAVAAAVPTGSTLEAIWTEYTRTHRDPGF